MAVRLFKANALKLWVLYIFLCILSPLTVFSLSPQTVPKEQYLTYTAFKNEQSPSKELFIAPDHWLKLRFNPPLIAKYQLDETTIVSITQFSGSIGDDLSNVNRWRAQLQLQPLGIDDLETVLLLKNGTKIISVELK